MTTKKTTEMSDAELQKNAKLLKVSLYTLGILNILLIVLVLANITKKGITPLLVVPLGLLPVLITGAGSLKNIKKEIAARNL